MMFSPRHITGYLIMPYRFLLNKKKTYLLLPFLFSLFSYNNISAQNRTIDSLYEVLGKTKKNDTNQLKTLCSLSEELTSIGNYSKSLLYAYKADTLAEQLEAEQLLATAFIDIANDYWHQGNYPQALYYEQKSLDINRQLNDKLGIAKNLNNMGYIYSSKGNDSIALKCYFQSLALHTEAGSKRGMAKNLNNIATLYWSLKNYPEALKYGLQSLALSQELNDKRGISLASINVGLIYYAQNDYAKALEYDFKALATDKDLDNYLVSTDLKNIAGVYLDQGNYSKSLEYFKKSNAMDKQSGDKEGIAVNYRDMGYLYIRQKNYKTAEACLDSSMYLARALGNKLIIEKVYRNKVILDSTSGNIKKLYPDYKQYIIYRDSIFNEANNKALSEIQTKYQTEKKQEQINSEEAIIQKKTYQLTLLIICLASVLVLTVFSIWFFTTKAKHENIKMQQKLLRSQMNPHFMFNSLSSIQGLILEKETEEAMLYTRKFSELMRQILENSREEYISLEEEIKTIENYMQLQKMRYESRFDYKIIIDNSINIQNIAIPPMLMQPFIENSIEHAFPEKRTNGLITITFSKDNSNIKFAIQDNGIGFAEAEKRKEKQSIHNEKTGKYHSRAIEITKERISLLNYRIRRKVRFEVEDIGLITNREQGGTIVKFSIPIKEV